MSPAEIALREAQEDWEEALGRWTQAQEDIRAAKAAWSAAQAEFFTGIKVLAMQASCSSAGSLQRHLQSGGCSSWPSKC